MKYKGSPGLWIKRQRVKLDLTQKELANEVGCSTIMIRKIEAEERRPSKPTARKLAESLKIPASEITDFLEFVRMHAIVSETDLTGADEAELDEAGLLAKFAP